jgi:hypothetical protein
MACGGEMTLMDAVPDDAGAAPSFEYRTFRCSECRDVERRLVFTKQAPQGGTAPAPEQAAPPTLSTRRMPAELTHKVPVEPTQDAPIEPAQTLPAQRAPFEVPAETPERGPAELAHPEPRGQTNAWGKALEKLNRLQERAAAEREAAGEAERRAQFNLIWDSFRSVPPPASSPEAPWQVKPKPDEEPDEDVRSYPERIAPPAPAAHEKPITPAKPERAGWLWRRFARGWNSW